MNLETKQIDNLELQLTLSITKEDYAGAEKKRLNDKKKNADIKGFRKGMAPMSLIQKFYGDQVLYESVNEVIGNALNNYIQENNLKIIGEPIASEDQPNLEWKSGADFTFKFDIAKTPEFTIEVSKEDKLPYYEIQITDVAKQEMKANLLQQFGSFQATESAKEKDLVIVDYIQEGLLVEGTYVAVDKVEGDAHSKFLGCKVGDSFQVNVNEAFSNASDRAAMLKIKKEELATLNPEFTVNVKEVKTFVPAEENQETYDKIFGKDKVKNAEEFDKAIEEQLSINYTQEADFRLSKDIRNHFISKANITLPENFLKRWLVKVNEGKFTLEQIEKDLPEFYEDYRWQLVRNALLEKFGVKIEEKDIFAAARGYASYQYAMYGMANAPEEMVNAFAERILKDERQARQIYEDVETQKCVEAIRPEVTLDVQKISVEKFRELK